MEKVMVSTDNAPKPPASYSKAVKAGGFVFVAGQGPYDPCVALDALASGRSSSLGVTIHPTHQTTNRKAN